MVVKDEVKNKIDIMVKAGVKNRLQIVSEILDDIQFDVLGMHLNEFSIKHIANEKHMDESDIKQIIDYIDCLTKMIDASIRREYKKNYELSKQKKELENKKICESKELEDVLNKMHNLNDMTLKNIMINIKEKHRQGELDFDNNNIEKLEKILNYLSIREIVNTDDVEFFINILVNLRLYDKAEFKINSFIYDEDVSEINKIRYIKYKENIIKHKYSVVIKKMFTEGKTYEQIMNYFDSNLTGEYRKTISRKFISSVIETCKKKNVFIDNCCYKEK